VAIAQLAEQGKLSFDDKVGKFLPEFPNADVRSKVAIHHLLTHTSGLGSYFSSPKFGADGPKIRTVNDYLEFVKGETLAFEPGARFQYSNSGFIVLGAIIEKITGQSYYDYVRDHVFKPAGMTGSASFTVDEKAPNVATGYVGSAGNRRPNTETLPGRGGPAGGGYSTAEDLLRFEAALRANKLLTAKMRDVVLAGKVPMGPNGKYAYGFGDFNFGGHRMVGHNGGAPGINSELQIFWDDGYTIIVMANYDRAASPLANWIRGSIFGGQ
jgi:CubicO group peptidase (beta-lactamase class C family)